MNIVRFRYLRADAEKMLLKIDQQTKGIINISVVRELYFELGYITGRVDERVKDLTKNSTRKTDYIEILSQLKKRRIKLEGLLERYDKITNETQSMIISRKYLYSPESVDSKKLKFELK